MFLGPNMSVTSKLIWKLGKRCTHVFTIITSSAGFGYFLFVYNLEALLTRSQKNSYILWQSLNIEASKSHNLYNILKNTASCVCKKFLLFIPDCPDPWQAYGDFCYKFSGTNLLKFDSANSDCNVSICSFFVLHFFLMRLLSIYI